MGVTLKHVAEKAGLSWQTVSKILSDQGHLFRPETRKRVIDAAKEMDYIPNAAARVMRTQQTRQIGLLLRNEEGHRFHNMAAFILLLGVNARLEKDGYLLSIVRLGDIKQAGHTRSRVFDERVLDGLIAFGNFPPEIFNWVNGQIPKGIWADTNVRETTCCLQRDEKQVGQIVAQHLLNMGYRQVVWTGDSNNLHTHYSSTDRYNALKNELCKHGIELKVLASSRRTDKRLIFTQLHQFFNPDTAIVSYNINNAQAILTSGASIGRTPGRDYGLICCDETPEVYESWPGLCRVSFDRFDLGYQAADMMLQLLDKSASKPVSRKLKSHWIIGNTAWGPKTSGSTKCLP